MIRLRFPSRGRLQTDQHLPPHQAHRSLLQRPHIRWVPVVVAALIIGASSLGAMALIAPKIKKQSQIEALNAYRSALIIRSAAVATAESNILKLKSVLAAELATVAKLNQLAPAQLSPGASAAGSSGSGAVPSFSMPSLAAPATHATTGASATAG